jgi:hypothetical protein
MLAVVGARTTFNKQEVRFLCSLPLFRKDIAVPGVILDTLSRHVAESADAYLGVSTRVIDSLRNPTNLMEQVYSVCKAGHEAALRIPARWSDVVALFMVLFVVNSLETNPRKDIVVDCLSAISAALKAMCREAIRCVEFILPYLPLVTQQCSSAVVEFGEQLIQQTVTSDPARREWVWRMSRVCVEFLVMNPTVAARSSTIGTLMTTITSWVRSQQSDRSEFFDQITVLQTYLVVNLMRYPFPDGASTPSALFASTVQSPKAFRTRDNFLVHIEPSPDRIIFNIQSLVGHFRWAAADIGPTLIDECGIDDFKFESLQDQEVTQRAAQKEFAKRLFDFYNDPEKPLLAIPDGSGVVDAVREEMERAATVQAEAARKLRPSNVRQHSPLSAFTAFGISDEHDRFFNRFLVTPEFRQALTGLEKKSIRLETQAAVLYYGRCTEPPGHFHEFVSALGWVVDLETHRGFMGGLPRTGASVYYSDALHELMFHVTGMLGDKAKLIEGDLFHVVWVDGNFEYNTLGSPSEKACAIIIVHPLPSGLFAVELRFAATFKATAGFLESVIVSKRVLPSFVRNTVLALTIAVIDVSQMFQFLPLALSNEFKALVKTFCPDRVATLEERQLAFLEA